MTDQAEVTAEPEESSTELVERAKEIIAAPQQRPDYRLAMEMGGAMAQSGYFKDAQAQAQAAVKMIIGLDLGISPTASMTAIHIVEGKPMIGYQIIAAKIIQDPHYGYEVIEHHDERCIVAFTDNRLGTAAIEEDVEADPPVEATLANEIGRVDWDMTRAQMAGLVKDKSGWKKSPRNMLFARCISDGTKFYMADLLTGAAVYVDDEIPEDRRALVAPDNRPQPLQTPEAEATRVRAQDAYTELRELNSTLLPPGAFNKLSRDATHSQAELENLVAHIEDLRDSEAEIQGTWTAIKERLADDALSEVERKFERKRSQGDRLAYLQDVLADAPPPPEAPEDDGKGLPEVAPPAAEDVAEAEVVSDDEKPEGGDE